MSNQVPVYRESLRDFFKYFDPLCKKCSDAISTIKVNNPNYDSSKDARILYFIFFREGIQSYILGSYLSPNLSNLEWWKNSPFKKSLELNKENIPNFLKDRAYNYNNWLNGAFFVSSFVDAENYLRLIAKAYDNGSCSDFTISKVVKNIITKLNLKQDYYTLWEIIAFTRNTMHNGGIHSKRDTTKIYKKTSFDFKKNEAINFLNSENLSFLYLELIDLLYAITSHPDIKAIPVIQHNHADIDFVQQ